MSLSILHIKNMVCGRCIRAVREELDKIGASIAHVELGSVELAEPLSPEHEAKFRLVLDELGFELLDDKRAKTIELIKNFIVNKIHHQSSEQADPHNFSTQISRELGMDYSYLSSLFSSVEGITIERYTILQRIEKVKELLVYDELSLSEMADELGYSSAAHLSSQFKKVTGMTTGEFKKLHHKQRNHLDHI